MDASSYDVAVIGLGAVGGAALYQLASRGLKAIGLDRFSPPHGKGSSHGETRIMRQAIGEGLHYSPFVLRANEIWQDVERELGRTLLVRSGFLFISTPGVDISHHDGADFLTTTRQAAERHGIRHEILGCGDIGRRFPQFLRLRGDETAYHEPEGGYLLVEHCIAAQLELARRRGAVVRVDTKVLGVEPRGDGVRIRTGGGTIDAARAIVAAGAWVPGMYPETVGRTLNVTGQVLHWFAVVDGRQWEPAASPTFVWAYGEAPEEHFYGFPPIQGEVKVAIENLTVRVDPDHDDAPTSSRETGSIVRHVGGRLAGIGSSPVRSTRCLYTMAPRHEFVVATHPESDAIRIVSACSGHGFKHAAAIGEALAADLAGDDGGLSLSAFRPGP